MFSPVERRKKSSGGERAVWLSPIRMESQASSNEGLPERR